MKKVFSLALLSICWLPVFGNSAENKLYFRAMSDEMNRTLKELRLPGELRPSYAAYLLEDKQWMNLRASLGALFPEERSNRLDAHVLLSIGSDKKNNTGYFNTDNYWEYKAQEMAPYSYDGIRQALWIASYKQYLESVEQYKEKEAYLRKKHIKDPKPDVIPATPATYVESIPEWQPVDKEALQNWLKETSARGKKLPFVTDFIVELEQEQKDKYYLNSRGAKAQWAQRTYACWIQVSFLQPDGKKEVFGSYLHLKDFSAPELARAEQNMDRFLNKAQGLYGASEAEFYRGPVLYEPRAAASFFDELLTRQLEQIVPLLNPRWDEDPSASSWRKKIGRRVMSPGVIVSDRPLTRTYKGVELKNFNPVDIEGVAAKDLTIISKGTLQQLPLSQRPLDKTNHASNGHAQFSEYSGVREGVTNIFIESETHLTNEQMEAKLLERCKALDLPYCYIKDGSVFQRIYTNDGHKEWVVGLKDNVSERSLRDILAVGGEDQLTPAEIVTPSILVDEVELKPDDRHPDRKPLISKPR